MSKFIKSKKAFALLATVVVAVAAAIGAYAYWTTSGSGSGSATVASDQSHLTITGNGVNATDLYPEHSVAISGNIHNPNPGAVAVNGVSGSVALAPASANSGCDVSAFSIDSVTYSPEATIAAGGDKAFSTHLNMADNGQNQDNCKGVGLAITWSSN